MARRTVRIPILLALFIALTLVLTAVLVLGNTETSHACGGGHHYHEETDKCHKHCQNGMSAHNSGHGEDYAVNNPSQLPGNNEMRGAWSTR